MARRSADVVPEGTDPQLRAAQPLGHRFGDSGDDGLGFEHRARHARTRLHGLREPDTLGQPRALQGCRQNDAGLSGEHLEDHPLERPGSLTVQGEVDVQGP